MDSEAKQDGQTEPGFRRARFRWRPLLLWLPGCLIVAGLVAKVAVMALPYAAPLILFPALVGLALGLLLTAIVRLAHLGHRPTVLAGAVVAVVAAVWAQHYLCYRAELARRQQAFATHPEAALAFADDSPKTLIDYLRKRAAAGRPLFGQGATVWLSWGLDAAIVMAATLIPVIVALKSPYCDRCRSWYRMTRAGALGDGDARRLLKLVGLRVPAGFRATAFRIQGCAAGCGPTLLEVFGQRPHGRSGSYHVWLDRALRDQVTHLLDR